MSTKTVRLSVLPEGFALCHDILHDRAPRHRGLALRTKVARASTVANHVDISDVARVLGSIP